MPSLISIQGKSFRDRDKNQFVIFVTPSIKASASVGSEKIKQKIQTKGVEKQQHLWCQESLSVKQTIF